MVLTLDDASGREGTDLRFVYVFVIDSKGQSQLLFPESYAGGVENRLPRSLVGALPREIRIRNFTVDQPYGVDTFLMLTSATPLADPSVLEGEAVRRSGLTSGTQDPLTRLLAQTGSTTRRVQTSTPTEWSLDRLIVQSVPPSGGRQKIP